MVTAWVWSRLVWGRYFVALSVFLLAAIVGDHRETDLFYLTLGMHLLVHGRSEGGVHLYVFSPEIQIGPAGFLLAGLLELVDFGHVALAAVFAAGGLLVVMLRSLELLSAPAQRDRARIAVLLAAIPLGLAWAANTPGWGHLEDLSALICLVLAVQQARAGRAVTTGLLLALATDFKPWAVFAIGIALLLPRADWARAAAGFAVLFSVCWLPFLVGDSRTVNAIRNFGILPKVGDFAEAVGNGLGSSTIRTAQFLVVTVLIVTCARWRRWELVVLAFVVGRLALDTGNFGYYDVELAVGAAVADVAAALRGRGRWVWLPLTLPAWISFYYLTSLAHGPVPAYLARLAVLVGTLLLATARSLVIERRAGDMAEGTVRSDTGGPVERTDRCAHSAELPPGQQSDAVNSESAALLPQT